MWPGAFLRRKFSCVFAKVIIFLQCQLMPFYPFQGILGHDSCKHPSLLLRGGPVCTERLWVLRALSRWILWQPVTSEPGPGSKTHSQASALGCLLSHLLHPRCVEGYQVLGGESECRYFSCLRRKDLHVRGKAAGVGSNPRRLRTRAGDLGSGRKHWCLDARWVVGSVGSSECPWSSPWMVKTPLRPWVKTRGRLMSDSQGCLLCFHLTCLTERSFLPLLPVLEVSLPTGGTSAKESACQCRRRERCGFDPWARNIPWRRKWQPTPVFSLGKFHGWRSLVGYSPWGCKELDMTEHVPTTLPATELASSLYNHLITCFYMEL